MGGMEGRVEGERREEGSFVRGYLRYVELVESLEYLKSTWM